MLSTLDKNKKNRLLHNLKIINHLLSELGLNIFKSIYFIKDIPIYIQQLIKFKHDSNKLHSTPEIINLFPCITDRYENAGRLDRHYFNQDLWAARKVYDNNPKHHIDVGSRIDGFVAHLLSFREVEVLDVRNLTSNIQGMTFRQLDLMQTNNLPKDICDSLSCLHALEHFGLGRYGDPIDPQGHIKGLNSLTKLLKSNGKLLLSVPLGRERVEFNAHRVFAIETIINLIETDYKLISFSYIDDEGLFYEDINYKSLPEMNYGCGMFELLKL